MMPIPLLIVLTLGPAPAPRASDLAPRASVVPRSSLLVPRSSAPDVIDRIVAVVAGQPITLSDVNAAIAFQIVPPPPASVPDVIGYTLDRLIERTLALAEVDRYQPPEPDPGEIATRLSAMKARLGTAFDRDLKATGLNEDAVRRYIRDDLRIQTYMNQRFGAVDPATRAELVSEWLTGLRRRSDVAVLYRGK